MTEVSSWRGNLGEDDGCYDATPALSGAPRPEAESFFQVLNAALREYGFVRDTYLNS